MGDRQSCVVNGELDNEAGTGGVVSLTLHVQWQVIPGHTDTCLIVTRIIMTTFMTVVKTHLLCTG